MKKDKKIVILIVAVLSIIDQITKIIAYTKGWIIQNNTTNSTNNGYYIVMSIIIILMIIRYIFTENSFIKTKTRIVLSFAIAGALGNMIDRIWNKDVLVFFKIGKFINFNLAYVYITIAWVGMAVILTKNTYKMLEERKKRNVKNYENNKHNSRK